MNVLQKLLAVTLTQQSAFSIGEASFIEGRISAIQDCISLLDEFERDIRFRTLGEVDTFIESLEGQYYEDEPFVIIRKQLKAMI